MVLSGGKRWRRGLAIWLVTVTLTTLSGGCWDRREPDQIATIVAIGVDRGKTQPLSVTFQVTIPRALVGGGGGRGGGGGGGGGGGAPFLNQTLEARGISEATRSLGEFSPRVVHLGHLQVMVISQDIARDGIAPLLDYLTSDREARRLIQMVVSTCPARDLLAIPTRLEDLPGISAAQVLRRAPEVYGLPESPMVRFLNALHIEGMEPLLPLIHTATPEGEIRPPAAGGPGGAGGQGGGTGAGVSGPGGAGSGGAGAGGAAAPQTMRVAGLAVFKNDRLVGVLNEQESRAVAWLLGKVHQSLLVIPSPQHGMRPVFLHLAKVRCQIQPRLQQGQPSVNLKLQVQGALLEDLSYTYDMTPESMVPLEDMAEQVMGAQIRDVVMRVQREFGSDIFGFGWAFYRRYPRLWRASLGPNWDQLFPSLPVDVEIKVGIPSAFLTRRSPLWPGK